MRAPYLQGQIRHCGCPFRSSSSGPPSCCDCPDTVSVPASRSRSLHRRQPHERDGAQVRHSRAMDSSMARPEVTERIRNPHRHTRPGECAPRGPARPLHTSSQAPTYDNHGLDHYPSTFAPWLLGCAGTPRQHPVSAASPGYGQPHSGRSRHGLASGNISSKRKSEQGSDSLMCWYAGV